MMKKNLMLVVFLLTLLLSGCMNSRGLKSLDYGFVSSGNQNEAIRWTLLTGKWFGQEMRADRSVYQWLTCFREDGTYETVFLNTYSDGTVERSVEVGEWGVSSNIHFTIFKGWIENGYLKPVTPQDDWTRDAYKILELTESTFRYRCLETGNTYDARRVNPEYEI